MQRPNQWAVAQANRANRTSIFKMKDLSKEGVRWLEVASEYAGQRIDNFLFRTLKGVPRSHIYRILRSGEVRADSRRIDAAYKLKSGEKLRIPPIRIELRGSDAPARDFAALFEDDALIAVNKPAGVAVHGGSGVSSGVIEQLRAARPEQRYLELVHRLDRETSGVLLIAKKRAALIGLHAQLRAGQIDKRYLALGVGRWRESRREINFPLTKFSGADNERRVVVTRDGINARTIFHLRERLGEFSLLEAELKTGRTHQIRVHLAHAGFPIAGDDKYGNFGLNKRLQREGLKRMFLHAAKIELIHPLTEQVLRLEAPLPTELEKFLTRLRNAAHAQPTL